MNTGHETSQGNSAWKYFVSIMAIVYKLINNCLLHSFYIQYTSNTFIYWLHWSIIYFKYCTKCCFYLSIKRPRMQLYSVYIPLNHKVGDAWLGGQVVRRLSRKQKIVGSNPSQACLNFFYTPFSWTLVCYVLSRCFSTKGSLFFFSVFVSFL